MYSENYYSFKRSRDLDNSISEYKSIIERLQAIHDELTHRCLKNEADLVKKHIDFISNALLYIPNPKDIDNLLSELASEFLKNNKISSAEISVPTDQWFSRM